MTNEQKFTTVEERHKAFNRFCKDYECKNCPLMYMGASSNTCVFNWLTLKVEEKPDLCPFCGSAVSQRHDYMHEASWCQCDNPECGYISGERPTESEAIAAHNRVCRAVKAYKESEVKE